jgi:hypothetical protein
VHPHGFGSLCKCNFPYKLHSNNQHHPPSEPQWLWGRLIPCDGTRGAIRDPKGEVVCAIDKHVGSLAWDLLISARVVTSRHWSRIKATGECYCLPWRNRKWWLLCHHSLRIHS